MIGGLLSDAVRGARRSHAELRRHFGGTRAAAQLRDGGADEGEHSELPHQRDQGSFFHDFAFAFPALGQ